MSQRETSLEAYRQIQAEGLLSRRRFQAYDIIFHHGPLTGNEVSRRAGVPGLWKRCSELEQMGVLQPAGQRVCTVTGRVAIVWEVTNRLPAQSAKKDRRRVPCGHCGGKGYLVEPL